MNSHISELPGRRERFWKIAKYSSFASPFVLGAFFIWYWYKQLLLYSSIDKFTFSLSTSAVALLVAATYFFTYKFYRENFYFFIFASWIANAIYLIPELNSPESCYEIYFYYKPGVLALSLTSNAFLLLALFSRTKDKSQATWREIPRSTWITILAVGLIYIVIAYIAILKLPVPYTICMTERHKTLAKWMLPVTVLSFGLLVAIAAALKVRLSDENLRWKGLVLSVTLLLYGVLQFFYPFIPYFSTAWDYRGWPLFVIAQVAKVGNAIAIVGVLQSAITHSDVRRDEEIREAEREMRVKEAELRAQEERLQRKSQFIELGMLASSIKHDVNTPLATMSFDIAVMKNKFQHNPEIIKRLERLGESMDRIYAIVKVVDILRGDKAFFDRDQFMGKSSILEVVHRAVRSVKNEKTELKLSTSKISIKVEGREVWMRSYGPMLEQVIVNVIKNGLEAISEAERERGLIHIRVGTTEIPESQFSRWVKVEISDNGCGIPPQNIDKLTTLFTTRSDKKPNSGIGLFIGKKILDIHNGDIKFESIVGEGTKVTLLLPEWNAFKKAEEVAGRAHKTDDPSTPETPLDEEPAAESISSETTETSGNPGAQA